jgi:O-antigen/teichoic acid export membrane protein
MSAEAIAADIAGEKTSHHKHLEKRALKGTGYVVIAYGLGMGLRLINSIVLSHLLAPAYFGLMALMTTIIVGLYLASHLGLEDGVIQNSRGEEREFLLTAWTIQVIRGTGLFLITIPLAFPVAALYHEQQLRVLLPLLGLACFIGAFSSPSLLVLARQMGVARVTLLELFTSVVQFIATTVWALGHANIWALVGGKLISEVARTIASYWVAPSVRPAFLLERKALGYLLRFGRWILVSTGLTFFAMQSDRLILGKLTSWQMLGIYGIAYSVSDIPRQIIAQFSSRVGYPFIARFSESPRPQFRLILIKYRACVLALGALLLVAVISTSDQLIKHVYDKRYHQAAWMVAVLGCGLWHTLMAATITPVLLSIQKAYYHSIAMACYCLTLFLLLPFGFHYWGMLGAVTAVAVSDLPVYIVSTIGMMREGLSFIRQDIKLTSLFLLLLALAMLLRHSLGLTMPFQPVR